MKNIRKNSSIFVNQKGVVSFITVMLLSIILVLITTGFVRSTISNQRQSLDNQLSTQAFYAAESGVNDALAMLKSSTKYEFAKDALRSSDCGAFLNKIKDVQGLGTGADVLNSNANIKYTCVLVNDEPSSIELSSPTIGEPAKFLIKGSGSVVDSLRITWGNSNQTPSSSGVTLLDQNAWGDNSQPLLRFAIYYPPLLANFSRDTLIQNQRTFFLKPVSSGGVSSITNTTADGSVVPVTCNGSECQVTITVGGSGGLTAAANVANGFYVVVTPIYTTSNIKIEGSSAGTYVNLSGAQYLIDVTGRANDVYRRVEVRRSIDVNYDFPDSSVTSGGDLCKQFVSWPGVNGYDDESATNCSF